MRFKVNYYDETDTKIDHVVEAESHHAAKRQVPSNRVNHVLRVDDDEPVTMQDGVPVEQEGADEKPNTEGGQATQPAQDDSRQAASAGGLGPQPGDGGAADSGEAGQAGETAVTGETDPTPQT